MSCIFLRCKSVVTRFLVPLTKKIYEIYYCCSNNRLIKEKKKYWTRNRWLPIIVILRVSSAFSRKFTVFRRNTVEWNNESLFYFITALETREPNESKRNFVGVRHNGWMTTLPLPKLNVIIFWVFCYVTVSLPILYTENRETQSAV